MAEEISEKKMKAMMAAGIMKPVQMPMAQPSDELSDEDMQRMVRSGLMKPMAQENPNDQPLLSAVEGFGNAVTLGYLPQIQALKDAAIDQVVYPENSDFEKDYVEYRDENLKRQAKHWKHNPYASGLGTVTGGVVSGIASAGVLPTGAPTALGRIAQTTGQGAAMGALSNPGDEEGKLAGGLQLGDRIYNSMIGGLFGLGTQVGMEGVTKGLDAGKHLGEIAKKRFKPNAQEIQDAGGRLNVPVTPGMLDDGGYVQRIEGTLERSPSLVGRHMAGKKQKVYDNTRVAVEDVLSDATPASPFQVGEMAKQGAVSKIGEETLPIQLGFEEVAEQTRHMPVVDTTDDALRVAAPTKKILGEVQQSQTVDEINAVREKLQREIETLMGENPTPTRLAKIKQLEDLITAIEQKTAPVHKVQNQVLNHDTMRLIGENKAVGQFVEMLNRAKNVDEIKLIRTMVKRAKADAEGLDRFALGALDDQLDRFEVNLIEQAAKTNLPNPEGIAQGRNVSDLLRDSRQNWAELMGKLRGFAKDVGFRGDIERPDDLIELLDRVRSEHFADKFFNTEDLRTLSAFRGMFPESSDLLRRGKLRDISQNSLEKGVLHSGRFVRQTKDINPEGKNLLFGNKVGKVQDIETLQNSLPPNFNPSGTASEIAWKDALNPWQNIKDLGNLASYKFASSDTAGKLSKYLLQMPKIAEFAKRNPMAFQTFVQDLLNRPEFQSAPALPDEPIIEQLIGYFIKNPEKLDQLQNQELKQKIKARLERQKAEQAKPATTAPVDRPTKRK